MSCDFPQAHESDTVSLEHKENTQEERPVRIKYFTPVKHNYRLQVGPSRGENSANE